jgi:hypothetical protein
MLRRSSINIEFSTEALEANLLRIRGEWEDYQSTRNRDGIYGYLTTVFELVSWWAREGKAVEYACRALNLKERRLITEVQEPFAAVIFCTADPDKVDFRMRSKWSRVLRYAAEFKGLEEPLRDFIKRKGGINKCATRYARHLGRGCSASRHWASSWPLHISRSVTPCRARLRASQRNVRPTELLRRASVRNATQRG